MCSLLEVSFDSEETLRTHQDNVRQSNEIGKRIREKVSDLIERIRDEERKLLQSVEEFRTIEQK